MAKKHIKTPRSSRSKTKRDNETLELANEFITLQDYTALRKLAAIRGLPNASLRSRCWPLLLGLYTQDFHDPVEYARRYQASHKDSRVVECDMARSLWRWTQGWTVEEREERRQALQRVINAVIASNESSIYYYQGLHDVAGVLLLTCGEPTALRLLSYLVKCHLRDCTQPTLAAVTEVLGLLYPLLQHADPELHAYITGFNEPALEVPYFALSWFMTWFSHDLDTLEECARLFDLFMASHPMMPLYVAVAAMVLNRSSVFAAGADGDLVYAALKGMKILPPGGGHTIDDLALQAAELHNKLPPNRLARLSDRKLQHATIVNAFLVKGRWRVPQIAPPHVDPRSTERKSKYPLQQRLVRVDSGYMLLLAMFIALLAALVWRITLEQKPVPTGRWYMYY